MIRARNQKEILLPYTIAPSAAVHAPTTTATLTERWVAPVSGKLVGVVIAIASSGALGGTTTDILETLKVYNTGIANGGTDVISDEVIIMSKAAATLKTPLINERIIIPGAAGHHVAQGECMALVWTESGTTTGITRPTFNVLGLLFEADSTIDPTLSK